MRRVWKPWLVSAAVLAVGMVLTAVLAALSLDRHRDRAELEFLAKVDQVHHVLHRTVEGYVDSLHAFVAFFVASETVTSGEFVRFAETDAGAPRRGAIDRLGRRPIHRIAA